MEIADRKVALFRHANWPFWLLVPPGIALTLI